MRLVPIPAVLCILAVFRLHIFPPLAVFGQQQHLVEVRGRLHFNLAQGSVHSICVFRPLVLSRKISPDIYRLSIHEDGGKWMLRIDQRFQIRLRGHIIPCIVLRVNDRHGLAADGLDIIPHAAVCKHRGLVAEVWPQLAALLCAITAAAGSVPRLDLARRVLIKPVVYLSWCIDLSFQIKQSVEFRNSPQFCVKPVRDIFKLHIFFCRWGPLLCILQIFHSAIDLLIPQIFVERFVVQFSQHPVIFPVQRLCYLAGFVVPCRPVFR